MIDAAIQQIMNDAPKPAGPEDSRGTQSGEGSSFAQNLDNQIQQSEARDHQAPPRNDDRQAQEQNPQRHSEHEPDANESTEASESAEVATPSEAPRETETQPQAKQATRDAEQKPDATRAATLRAAADQRATEQVQAATRTDRAAEALAANARLQATDAAQDNASRLVDDATKLGLSNKGEAAPESNVDPRLQQLAETLRQRSESAAELRNAVANAESQAKQSRGAETQASQDVESLLRNRLSRPTAPLAQPNDAAQELDRRIQLPSAAPNSAHDHHAELRQQLANQGQPAQNPLTEAQLLELASQNSGNAQRGAEVELNTQWFGPAQNANAVTPTPVATEARVPASAAPEVIAIRVEQLAEQGGGTARLHLHPPNLGEVTLQVRVRGNVVDVSMVAREMAAQILVEGGREHLSEALASRELRMENFEVTTAAKPGEDGTVREDANMAFRDFEMRREGREANAQRPEDGPPKEMEAPLEALMHQAAKQRGGVDLRV